MPPDPLEPRGMPPEPLEPRGMPPETLEPRTWFTSGMPPEPEKATSEANLDGQTAARASHATNLGHAKGKRPNKGNPHLG